MRPTKKLAFLFFLFLITNTRAQLTVDAEVRPRFEYRHGFKTLFPDNEDAAAFVVVAAPPPPPGKDEDNADMRKDCDSKRSPHKKEEQKKSE